MIETNKIYNTDCLEGLKNISNKSINLAVYDAPYFSTGIKQVGDKQWKKEEDYITWCIQVIKETQRVLKDNGSFYWFHNDINIMTEILYRIKHETDFKLKNQITWDKLATANDDFMMPLFKNADKKRRYGTSLTEYVYYFTFQDATGLDKVMKDKNNFKSLRDYSKQIQNNIGLKLKEINNMLGNRRAEHFFYHSSTQWDLCTEEVYDMLINTFKINEFDEFKEYKDLRQEYELLRKQYEGLIEGYESQRYSYNRGYINIVDNKNLENKRKLIRPYTTTWHYSRDEEIYKKHLTPKPLEMIKHIINISSNKNDMVLDCFSGSGTTAIACLDTNRNYIGFELDENYYNLANKRIQDHIKDLNNAS